MVRPGLELHLLVGQLCDYEHNAYNAHVKRLIAHHAHCAILRRMSTEKRDEKVPVLFTSTELKELDDWSFGQRIRSRGEAIRRLIARGLQAERDDAAQASKPK